MSSSAFHLDFKSMTAMSPLQYQKRLRLPEARRLRLGAGLDAAEAAFHVGYESPSQFSREYRRKSGAPPRQDVAAPCDPVAYVASARCPARRNRRSLGSTPHNRLGHITAEA
jgi:AraC-like DNA-binding protein